MDETGVQILRDAKAILPSDRYDCFEEELQELIREPRVWNWHARSLRIFITVLEFENVAKRLFRYLQTSGERFSFELSFLQSAYQNFSSFTFELVLFAMLEFANLGPSLKQRLVGHRILNIIREGAIQHEKECRKSGVAFPLRYYEKFEFLFEMLFTLDQRKYMRLLNAIYIHEKKSLCNVEEFENLRTIAEKLLGPNAYLKQRLWDFCTRGKCEIFQPRTCNSSPKSRSVASQNKILYHLLNSETLTSDLDPPVKHNQPVPEIRRNLESQTTGSGAVVGQNHFSSEHRTSEDQQSDSVAPIRQNQSSLNLRVSDNPTLNSVSLAVQPYCSSELRISEVTTPDLIDLVPYNHPVSDIQISKKAKPSSAATFGQNHSRSELRTSEDLKSYSEVPVFENQSRRELRVSSDPTLNSVALAKQPYSSSGLQISEHSTPDLMDLVSPVSETQILKNPEATFRQNNPRFKLQTSENLTSDLVAPVIQDQSSPDRRVSDNSFQNFVAPAGRSHSSTELLKAQTPDLINIELNFPFSDLAMMKNLRHYSEVTNTDQYPNFEPRTFEDLNPDSVVPVKLVSSTADLRVSYNTTPNSMTSNKQNHPSSELWTSEDLNSDSVYPVLLNQSRPDSWVLGNPTVNSPAPASHPSSELRTSEDFKSDSGAPVRQIHSCPELLTSKDPIQDMMDLVSKIRSSSEIPGTLEKITLNSSYSVRHQQPFSKSQASENLTQSPAATVRKGQIAQGISTSQNPTAVPEISLRHNCSVEIALTSVKLPVIKTYSLRDRRNRIPQSPDTVTPLEPRYSTMDPQTAEIPSTLDNRENMDSS